MENLSNLLSVYYVSYLGPSDMVEICVAFILDREEQKNKKQHY